MVVGLMRKSVCRRVRAAAGARRGYMRQMQRPTLGKGSSGASLLNLDTTTSVKLGQTKDIGAAALASWWWLLGFMSVWTGSGQIRAATWVATQWPGRWSKVGWHPIHALAPLQPGVEYWLVRLSEDHKNGDWRIFFNSRVKTLVLTFIDRAQQHELVSLP